MVLPVPLVVSRGATRRRGQGQAWPVGGAQAAGMLLHPACGPPA